MKPTHQKLIQPKIMVEGVRGKEHGAPYTGPFLDCMNITDGFVLINLFHHILFCLSLVNIIINIDDMDSS